MERGRGQGGRGEGALIQRNNPLPPEQPADGRMAIWPDRKRRRRRRSRRRRRTRRTKRREEGTKIPHRGPSRGHSCGGGRHPPRGKRGPPRILPITCTPVVAGSLWRLPGSQRQDAPGRGNSRQRCMAALQAPACCQVSELAHHALWSCGAPLHSNLGSGMAGGSR